MNAPVRPSVVAGRFYPGTAAEVAQSLAQLRPAPVQPVDAIALMVPHAGWIYSGAIAAETWASAKIPSRVVLMCPNHTGQGARRSIWSGGPWQVPGGQVEVDEPLTDALARACALTPDVHAHAREHAIEVQLPMLRALRPDVRIAAICLAGLDADACARLGEALAEVVAGDEEPPLLVASSDMSHYVSAHEAATLDELALARALALDPDGLHDVVRRRRISMCGVVPMTVTLHAARRLGARSARLVRYGNSGERSGDFDRVVGYAGVLVTA